GTSPDPLESDASSPEEEAASITVLVLPAVDSISSPDAVLPLPSNSTLRVVSPGPDVPVPEELLPPRVPAVSVPEVVVSVVESTPSSSPQATRSAIIATRHTLVRNDIGEIGIDAEGAYQVSSWI